MNKLVRENFDEEQEEQEPESTKNPVYMYVVKVEPSVQIVRRAVNADWALLGCRGRTRFPTAEVVEEETLITS